MALIIILPQTNGYCKDQRNATVIFSLYTTLHHIGLREVTGLRTSPFCTTVKKSVDTKCKIMSITCSLIARFLSVVDLECSV